MRRAMTKKTESTTYIDMLHVTYVHAGSRIDERTSQSIGETACALEKSTRAGGGAGTDEKNVEGSLLYVRVTNVKRRERP